MNRCAIILLLSLHFPGAFSQTLQIDSLKAILPDVSGNQKAEVLYKIAVAYSKLDQTISLQNLNEAIKHSDDSLQLVKLLRGKGMILSKLNRVEEVPEILGEMLAFAKKKKLYEELVDIYDLLGTNKIYLGEYGAALKYYYSAIPLLSLDSLSQTKPYVYNNLGLLYYKLRSNEKALQYFKKCYFLSMSRNPINVVNIGLAYSELDSVSRAMPYLEEANRICANSQDSIHFRFVHFGYGMAYIKLGKLDSAERHLKKSLLLSVRTGDKRMEAEGQVYMARVFLETRQWDSVAEVLKAAEEIAIDQGYNEILLDVSRQSIQLYKNVGDKERLADYQDKFITQKEMLYNTELARDMALAEGELLEREHMRTISFQKQQIDYQNSILKYQNWISWIGVFITLLLALLIRSKFQHVKESKRIKHLLENKVEERVQWLQDQRTKLALSRTKREAVLLRNNKKIIHFIADLELVKHEMPENLRHALGQCIDKMRHHFHSGKCERTKLGETEIKR